MNTTEKRDVGSEEVSRIRSIVQRHKLPDFVSGFHVRLGEFDGDPAMWIIFDTLVDDKITMDDRIARSEVLARLREGVGADLRAEVDDRFPFFRFAEVAPHHAEVG